MIRRAGGDGDRSRTLLIVAVFLATRLAVLALYAPELEAGDQTHYVRAARSILDHGFASYLDPGFTVQKGSSYPYFRSHPSLPDGPYNPIFWDPLYPLFLSLVFRVAGESLAAVRGVQLGLSLLGLLLGMQVVRRMFPENGRAAECFGWLTVAYLPFAGFVGKLFAETLDAFLLTVLLWMTSWLVASRPRAFLAFGALLGLYISIKSYWLQLLPFLGVLFGWLLLRSPRRPDARGLAARLLLLLAGVGLVLAPTFVRNHNIGGGAWLLSTKGSWNFWKDNNHFKIVNHAWREEGLMVHTWLDAYYRVGDAGLVPTDLEGVYEDASTTRVRPPCDTNLAGLLACERRNAIGFFLEDPLRFARRALEKNANLWSPNSYIFNRAPPGSFAWNQNYRIELPPPVRYLLQLWVIGVYLLGMLAFFVGVALPAGSEAHRSVRAFTLLSLVFMTLVVVPWGHGVTRFRLPYMVPILMFASLGLLRARWELPRLLRFEHPARSGAVGLLVGALAAICAARLPLLLAP